MNTTLAESTPDPASQLKRRWGAASLPGAQGKQSGAKGLHRPKSERSPVAALALLPLDKGNNSVVALLAFRARRAERKVGVLVCGPQLSAAVGTLILAFCIPQTPRPSIRVSRLTKTIIAATVSVVLLDTPFWRHCSARTRSITFHRLSRATISRALQSVQLRPASTCIAHPHGIPHLCFHHYTALQSATCHRALALHLRLASARAHHHGRNLPQPPRRGAQAVAQRPPIRTSASASPSHTQHHRLTLSANTPLSPLFPHCFALQGFYARPAKAADGSLDLMNWEVGIPGKANVGQLPHLVLSFASAHSPLALCCSATTDAMGGRAVQAAHDVSRRIPEQAAQVQVHAAALPSQRLSLGHRLPEHPRRGQGLEAGHHDQADPARHSRSAQRSQPARSRTERGLHHVPKGRHRLRAQSASAGARNGHRRLDPSRSKCHCNLILLVPFTPRCHTRRQVVERSRIRKSRRLGRGI
ncbi:hypothetical protein L1887_53966 [Cichorium endivia]|nr:hypothetical protein L1887_53966 [Cichorium endivia]